MSLGDATVTVGIASYNAADVLPKLLESVVKQSFPKQQIEVIVTDDGSIDNTAELARQYHNAVSWLNFTVTEQQNTGTPWTGRNHVIEQAAGDYIFFADDDDWFGPGGLEAVVDSARQNESDVVIGQHRGVGRWIPRFDLRWQRTNVLQANLVESLTIQKLFRAEFLRELDYRFNPEIRYAGDHAFMLAAYLNTDRISMVPDVDTYFLTALEGREHITERRLPPEEQFRFIGEAFSVLDAAETGTELAQELVGPVRARYWERLLRVHIPLHITRYPEKEDLGGVVGYVRYLVAEHRAEEAVPVFTDEALMMLEALGLEKPAEVLAAAERVRLTRRLADIP